METRIRMSGKLQGSSYKTYKSPDGFTFFSLKKAAENGFNGYTDNRPADRRCVPKTKAAKAAPKGPARKK